MFRSDAKTLAIIICLGASLFAAPAFAYLDPGTGSAILQGILGALAVLVVTAKLYWHRLLRLLGLKKDKPAAGLAEKRE